MDVAHIGGTGTGDGMGPSSTAPLLRTASCRSPDLSTRDAVPEQPHPSVEARWGHARPTGGIPALRPRAEPPARPGPRDGRGIVIGAAGLHDTHGGGLNRFTESLVGAMLSRHEGLSVVTASARTAARFPNQVVPIRAAVVAEESLRGNLARLVWHQAVLPRLLRRAAASVFFSPVAEGMLAPPCPQVITVPDLIPLHYPEMFARLGLVYRHVIPRLIAASAAVVAMSESTRRDVQRFFPEAVRDRPVHVVLQGYRSDVFRPLREERLQEVRARYGLGRYVFAVGETRPYKNTRRLVQAFVEGRFDGVQLALAGRVHPTDLGPFADTASPSGAIRLLGYVPDEDLAALYGGAEAFVFPSMYEGFGIPALEAMACGCPVVAAAAASLPEVCGDAAVYVDPHSTDAIARGIATVLSDGAARAELRVRGLERARLFTYEAAAEQVMTILGGVQP